MNRQKRLLLFTHNYPFGYGENFLDDELPHLLNYFCEIVIVPNEIKDQQRPLPKNVRVETDFALALSMKPLKRVCKRIFKALTTSATYSEIARAPSQFFNLERLRVLLYFTSQREFYSEWLKTYLNRFPAYQEALFYSYWLHIQSQGISLLKKRHFPEIKHISRAHSYEIYLEDYPPSYYPFREEHLPAVDHIYTVSDHAQERLLHDHAKHIRSISTLHLGVREPGFINPHSSSNQFNLVSTSSLIELKRIDLLIEALEQLHKIFPTKNISWNHFGDGPLYNKLSNMAEKKLGNKIDWTLHGRVNRDKMFQFYQNTPIDLFINTSRTEGIPVSIMEALSCGIPIVATDTGAVSEIVDSRVGRLLPKMSTPTEIAEAIANLANDKTLLSDMRREARLLWHAKYDADKNYAAFANKISEGVLA